MANIFKSIFTKNIFEPLGTQMLEKIQDISSVD